MSTPSLRENAIWSLAGSGALQLSNLLVLLAISRLLGTEALGNFSYAIALCAPIIAFSTLGLRNLQVIESSERYCNDDFRRVQFIASLVAVSTILILANLSGRHGEALLTIFSVALSQAVSSQMDTLFAFFQKVRRMDVAARCRIANAVVVLPTCLVVAYTTRSLVAVVIAMIMVRFLSMYLHVEKWLHALESVERFQQASWERIQRLAFSSIPIAAMTGVVTLDVSIPSLFLDKVAGPTVLGHFMIVSTICLPVSFVLSSILQASLPYLSGDSASRSKIANRLIACVGVLSTSAFLVIYFFGSELLKLFLGQGYVPIERQLMISLGVGFVSLVATILSYSLLAKRAYRVCLLFSALGCVSTFICSYVFVPRWFLTGAILAPLVGKIICIVLASAALQKFNSMEIETENSSVFAGKHRFQAQKC